MEIGFDDRAAFVSNMQNRLGKIEDMIDRIKAGGDVEKPYLLAEIEDMERYVKRSL